jgi:hypothetical protein
MFDDGAVDDVESAGAGNANSGRAGTLRLLATFTRRLPRAKTPSDVGNGHVRVMNVPRGLETFEARRRLAAFSYFGEPAPRRASRAAARPSGLAVGGAWCGFSRSFGLAVGEREIVLKQTGCVSRLRRELVARREVGVLVHDFLRTAHQRKESPRHHDHGDDDEKDDDGHD